MLIEFTVGNFLSFKEKKTLSLQATRITENEESYTKVLGEKLLKSAVIYGANSSGKSNLINAMAAMRYFILNSIEKSSASEFDVTPFLLNKSTVNEPSFFEILFTIDDRKFRYGFEIDKKHVHSEWLFEFTSKEEKTLFIRDIDGIGISEEYKEGLNLEDKTRENTFFLSVVDQFNGNISRLIIKWFNQLNVIYGLIPQSYQGVTYDMLKDTQKKEALVNFYKELDLGFEDIILKEEPFNKNLIPRGFPDELTKTLIEDLKNETFRDIETIHNKYDDKNRLVEKVKFSMNKQESSGTKKIFDISGPIFDTLSRGAILFIDELDARLHPSITKSIVNLFNNKNIKYRDAQLIFVTHDTSLLKRCKFRRDQIYFVEKNRYGASDLYSLIEFREPNSSKPPRKDRNFEKDYIEGRYGAIPFLGNLEEIL